MGLKQMQIKGKTSVTVASKIDLVEHGYLSHNPLSANVSLRRERV